MIPAENSYAVIADIISLFAESQLLDNAVYGYDVDKDVTYYIYFDPTILKENKVLVTNIFVRDGNGLGS